MIHLNEAHTSKLITHELAYDAIKNALTAVISDNATLFPVVNAGGAAPNTVFSLKAACTDKVVGWKTGSYWPNNASLGRPCHGTTIFLLDRETGALKAIIEASAVNAYRTAAADAVAVDYLARKDSTTLAIFGTGHQAEYEAMAVCNVRSINSVFVVGRSSEKANIFVERLKAKGLNAKAVDAQLACMSADIIVTATTSSEPLFRAEWVKPGTHISAMGADKKGKQELPVELYSNALLFCDFAKQSVEIGELQHTSNSNITNIGEVINATSSGRTSANDITIFDSSGIALQDLFIAEKLLNIHEGN